MITIPAPTLPASAPLSQPMKIAVTGVKLADGSAAAPADIASAGVFVFRGSPGTGEVWDEAQKKWVASPADDALLQLQPIVAAPNQDSPAKLEATLVAIGKKDAANADAFAPAASGTPTYFVRALVKTTHAGTEDKGLSAPSAAFSFTDAASKSRFQTQFDTPSTKSEDAHKVRMQLRSESMQPVGYLEIRSQPDFEVEIANCDGSGNPLAKILLRANGEIHLTPGGGARVVIDSDIEVNRLTYAPAGGGPKKLLA
jgi:hypothetical protein